MIQEGGVLVTMMYPLARSSYPEADATGPPFMLSFALYEELLTPVGFEAIGKPQILPDELCHPGRGDGNSGIGRWVRVKTS